MGEIADMMLDGALCEGCGEYMGNGGGYVRLCSGCSKDNKPVRKKDILFPKKKPKKKAGG